MIENNAILHIYNRLSASQKFPRLQKGDIGIQIGFDLSSKNLTTDLLLMYHRVGRQGQVIGIDPDDSNIARMRAIVSKFDLPIQLITCGTGSTNSIAQFQKTTRAAHNIVKKYGTRHDVKSEESIQIKTLDSITKSAGIDVSKIKHINISNNGAEYDTLKGAINLFSNLEDVTVTVISGRNGELGMIGGERDYQVVSKFLQDNGFKTDFIRPADRLWWGGVQRVLVKKRWPYGKNREKYFGAVIGKKGNHVGKFQSYS